MLVLTDLLFAAEIFVFGRFTVLLKVLTDVHVYLIAEQEENESLLASTLDCMAECLQMLAPPKTQLNNVILTENFSNLILIIDELISNG